MGPPCGTVSVGAEMTVPGIEYVSIAEAHGEAQGDAQGAGTQGRHCALRDRAQPDDIIGKVAKTVKTSSLFMARISNLSNTDPMARAVGVKQLYTARDGVQPARVAFLPHCEKTPCVRRKDATFYVSFAQRRVDGTTLIIIRTTTSSTAARTHTMYTRFLAPARCKSLALTSTLCFILCVCAASHAGTPAPSVEVSKDERPASTLPQPRPQDELWLVSCRGLSCNNVEQEVGKLGYWRYDRNDGWVKASLAEQLATDDPHVITTVFVHGNRIPWGEAFCKGWRAYWTLARCADERPIRFVIWSWPSEPLQGLINDARTKAWRTDPAGYYLGWYLDQLSPEAPVSLWAHSFGARIVTGALHLLGGGAVAGNQLDQRLHATRQPMQVVLLAAALDSDWLIPGHCHGSALSQVASMLLVNNCSDALLKRYHLIYGRRSCEQALGYTGMSSWSVPPDDLSKVSQVDASYHVGKRHLFDLYISSPDLVSRMRPVLMFQPTNKAPQTVPEVVATTTGDSEALEP